MQQPVNDKCKYVVNLSVSKLSYWFNVEFMKYSAVKFLSTCYKVAVALFDLPADVSFRENPMHIDNAYFRLKCKQGIFTGYIFFLSNFTYMNQTNTY